jgi:hypothetical protein
MGSDLLHAARRRPVTAARGIARRQVSALWPPPNETLSNPVEHAILQTGSRRWLMITIEITAGLLLAFFWAFWVFAFGGWWCGGGC